MNAKRNHNHVKRENACLFKVVYESMHEALAAVRGKRRAGKRLRPYRCSFCHQFHLTSRGNR